MRLLDTPVRLLLVAIFGFALPLLCCCPGMAQAEPAKVSEVVSVNSAPAGEQADHACCVTADTAATSAELETHHRAQEPQPAEHSCECGHEVAAAPNAMIEAVAARVVVPVDVFFFLAPLPAFLANVGDICLPPVPIEPEQSAADAAPSLRSLSVLLLI